MSRRSRTIRSGRANVLALVRGTGTRTVLLSGHFDTVPVDDYGPLKDLAGSAEQLLPRLVEALEASGEDPRALDDFMSGDFLPGRGLLDMKSGIAAGIAVVEAFAANPARRGNLLFAATPDEEDRSVGMRAAAELLPVFLRERGLEVPLAINLDAICDEGDGSSGRVVAFGCIGKLLLSALVVGQESHAAYPLAGVNAAYLAAELTAEMEFAPELGEEGGGELAAPPTVLGSRDLKAQYNVTIPGAVWTYWNVLLHRRTAKEVMEAAETFTRRALDRAAARDGRAAPPASRDPSPERRLGGTSRSSPTRSCAKPRCAGGRISRARFAVLGEELRRQGDLDLPTRSRRLVEATWAASGLKGPAVVLGFGAMPYPAVPLAGRGRCLACRRRGRDGRDGSARSAPPSAP